MCRSLKSAGVAGLGLLLFAQQAHPDPPGGVNKVEWAPTYPIAGRGNFKVKGTSTPKAGWKATTVTLNYRLQGAMNWAAVDLDPADPNNWGEFTQSVPFGAYEAKVVVRFVDLNNSNNTEIKETVSGFFTVRPPP